VREIIRLPLEDASQALERYRTGHVRGEMARDQLCRQYHN
jgi:hypothetical protein